MRYVQCLTTNRDRHGNQVMDAIRSWLEKRLARVMHVPRLTSGRVATAFALAVVVDGAQLALGPAGWIMADELLDVGTALATGWLLGFHPLLLPTFLIELFPVVDVLPTWTGCVGLLVGLRRREQRRGSSTPTTPPSSSSGR
jgi:hypothetical protein